MFVCSKIACGCVNPQDISQGEIEMYPPEVHRCLRDAPVRTAVARLKKKKENSQKKTTFNPKGIRAYQNTDRCGRVPLYFTFWCSLFLWQAVTQHNSTTACFCFSPTHILTVGLSSRSQSSRGSFMWSMASQLWYDIIRGTWDHRGGVSYRWKEHQDGSNHSLQSPTPERIQLCLRKRQTRAL